jgi:pimeloyl-ACP methyl ester carboxylesterase
MSAKAISLGLATLLSASAIAVAQTAPTGQVCTSSAWTGTVSYSRTQHLADSSTTDRVSGRGKDTKDFELNYNYKALVAVAESPYGDGSNVATATVNHKMSSKETAVSKESNSCDRGKSWQTMSGTFTTEQVTTGQGKDSANVTIGVRDDGTYTVGVAAPRIKGMTSGSQKSTFSGQCTKKEGKEFNYPQSETGIEGGSLTSDGRHRVDPDNPTRLSGSYSQTHQNITESITWNLQKCGAPLRVTNLTFEDMRFPNWDTWRDLDDQTGTVDGNFVRIKATVFNASAERRSGEVQFKETYKGDHWDGKRPDAPLKDPTFSVSLEPGEAKEVELLWDSSGYAWFDDGRPRLVQRVKAELWEKNKRVDEMTRNLKVAPKPLVLAHGTWSEWTTFEPWQNLLTLSHSYDWKAFPVGENPSKGKFQYIGVGTQVSTVEQASETLQSYIRYAQLDRNAWHVDIVGHGGGGVVARHYISRMMPEPYPDMRPQIAHLVMLGTPNMGTSCAESVTADDPRFLRQLRRDSMEAFNQVHVDRKGVKFSTLAGTTLLPIGCLSIGATDGLVPVPSAHWTIADRGESDSDHLELTGTRDFSDFVKPRLAIGPKGDHSPAR